MDTPILSHAALLSAAPGGDGFEDVTHIIELATQGEWSAFLIPLKPLLMARSRKRSHAGRGRHHHATLHYDRCYERYRGEVVLLRCSKISAHTSTVDNGSSDG